MSGDVLPTDLDGVLADSQLHKQFREYLMYKGSADCLLMYNAIQDYERKHGEGESEEKLRSGAARKIILRFLSEGQQYLGIERNLRDNLVRAAYNSGHSFNTDVFEVCKVKLMEWMSENYLAQFLMYKKTGKLRSDNDNSRYRAVRDLANRMFAPVRKAVRKPSKYLPAFSKKEPSKSRDGSSEEFLHKWT